MSSHFTMKHAFDIVKVSLVHCAQADIVQVRNRKLAGTWLNVNKDQVTLGRHHIFHEGGSCCLALKESLLFHT